MAIARFACRLAAFPNRIGGALVFGLAVAIMVNALMLQHTRHPAPLFHKSILLPPPKAPAPDAPARAGSAQAPHGNSRASESPALPHDPITQLLKSKTSVSRQTAEPEKTRPPQHHHFSASEHAAVSEARPAAHDPISQLLKTSPLPPARAEEQPKTVLAAQHALVKLGFVLRADGHMGAVTRHAIKQYEHDRGLPIHGELTPKLVHRLAAESGISVE